MGVGPREHLDITDKTRVGVGPREHLDITDKTFKIHAK